MITRKQIIRKTLENKDDPSCSKLLFATLDRDYQLGNCIIPIKTIVQVKLFRIALADLCINGRCVDAAFPYDAATLLEDE